MTDDIPFFMDFEASSLGPMSYPIQVAWSNAHGDIECWLIDPSSVEVWDDWDPNSEAIHQIKREQLVELGKSPKWVAARMNEQLREQTVYATSAYDSMWLSELFDAAELTGSSPLNIKFFLRDAWQLFRSNLRIDRSLSEVILDVPLNNKEKDRVIEQLSIKAWRNVPGRRHDAGNDVRQLVELWWLIKELSEK